MATVIDALALELSLDPRQFEQGLKSVVEKVKVTRDDYERHAKSFEAVATSLFRAITPLIGAIIGIGTALEAIDWSKHAAAATTEFTNLADVLGMNIEKLSAWRQAAEAAGKGGGDALVQAMARQQQTMLTMLPGGTGLKDYEFLRALQRYGMANVSQYLDANGNLDMDKFEKDLTSASERVDKIPAERAQWMARLYVTNPANLSLLKNRAALEAELAHQRDVVGVLNKDNADAMKQLHKDWSELEFAAENLRIQIVTNLAKPLESVLNDIMKVLNYLKSWDAPDWLKSLVHPETGEIQLPKFLQPPSLGLVPGGEPRSEFWNKFGIPRSDQSWSDWLGLSGPKTWGGMLGTTPAPAAPAPSATTPSTPAPATPPANFEERFRGAPATPGPSGALDLPQYAMDLGRSEMTARSGNTVSNSSNITIGAMSFNSRATDTELEHAPAGSERTLSVGQYAVLANTSLI